MATQSKHNAMLCSDSKYTAVKNSTSCYSVYTVSQKNRHLMFCYNCGKCELIFEILLPENS